MARARVFSFMKGEKHNKSPTTQDGPKYTDQQQTGQANRAVASPAPPQGSSYASASSTQVDSFTDSRESTPSRNRQRASSLRPMSMIGGYQPPMMEIAQDTVPELAPVFKHLNAHSNKLYQEGYFLKLNDLDTAGRPFKDRSWTECFAQLVGTVLSLWDASALDAAGEDGEVAPTFINLSDASIKMIQQLPTRSNETQPLQNVLSISTAGKNRFLFHFSNINTLTQWTAGIRLAMFEHASLQEAYTGSLIAGKGRMLNNIKMIMERTRFKTDDWVRVRFGAGTPWRRCWCVVEPPDEKETAKFQKANKKRSAYDRSPLILQGTIKFYEKEKVNKKAQPVATIRDAYSAYAIYPQSKPLIEQSTLIKIEGTIVVHSSPETVTEGFVFIMPENHAAITGFEIMLRFLFPIYDIFGLYGRPRQLIPDKLDPRSLMFAFEADRHYGYLEVFDVAALIHTEGSDKWTELEWRKQLRKVTSERMSKIAAAGSQPGTRMGSRHGHRNSLPSRSSLHFNEPGAMKSTQSLSRDAQGFASPSNAGSAPPGASPFGPPDRGQSSHGHARSNSETIQISPQRRQQQGQPQQQQQQRNGQEQNGYTPSRLSYERNNDGAADAGPPPPPPPVHGVPLASNYRNGPLQRTAEADAIHGGRSSSESEHRTPQPSPPHDMEHIQDVLQPNAPPTPVAAPPAFLHRPGAMPPTRPYQSPELRRANSRMSSTTLSQLAAAGNSQGVAPGAALAAAGAAAAWKAESPGRRSEDQYQRSVNENNAIDGGGANADNDQGMVLAGADHSPAKQRKPLPPSLQPSPHNSYISQSSATSNGHLISPSQQPRSPSPLAQHATAYPSSDSAPLQREAQTPSPYIRNFSRQNSYTRTDSAPSTPPADAQPQPSPLGLAEPLVNEKRLSEKSITRKPIPSPVTQTKSIPTRASVESLKRHTLDQDAFDQVSPMAANIASESPSRQASTDSSHYAGSDITPEYASTIRTNDTSGSSNTVERPRQGVLRTVGGLPEAQDVVIGDVRYRTESGLGIAQSSSIPNIDFGPTQVYRPDILSPAQHARTGSPEQNGATANSSGPPSPFPRSKSAQGGESYMATGVRSGQLSPEPSPNRSASALSQNGARSIAWAPGMAAGRISPDPRRAISPEEFVQQRSANTRVTPVYAHQPINAQVRSLSATPPAMNRTSSGDWTGQNPSRPNSRGPSAALSPDVDYTAHLSAREQEHVARATGSPLINLGSKDQRTSPSSGGLVGAIEAREQEKKQIKAGVSSQMVQHAINQRQQQAINAGQVNYYQPRKASPSMPQTQQDPAYTDWAQHAQPRQEYFQQQTYPAPAQNAYATQQAPRWEPQAGQSQYWNNPITSQTVPHYAPAGQPQYGQALGSPQYGIALGSPGHPPPQYGQVPASQQSGYEHYAANSQQTQGPTKKSPAYGPYYGQAPR